MPEDRLVVTALLVCLALALFALATGPLLLHVGLRTGDRLGDTTVSGVEPDGAGHGVRFTVHNPGPAAVVIGASLRRRSLRLYCEGGRFVRVPWRTARGRHRARRHALVCALAAGETQSLTISRDDATPRRAQLVVAIGEVDRLRVEHRAVTLPPPWAVRPQGDVLPACALPPR